jgi:hypothetical protein
MSNGAQVQPPVGSSTNIPPLSRLGLGNPAGQHITRITVTLLNYDDTKAVGIKQQIEKLVGDTQQANVSMVIS